MYRVFRETAARGDFNAMERGLDVDVSPLRVRLQPIYSDRSLEAIQIRYRENAGVINRLTRPWLVTCYTSNALAFDRPPLIGVHFYGHRRVFLHLIITHRSFYSSIIQFVVLYKYTYTCVPKIH